ncbi:uncharacterized protein NECHADRAFT_89462 [Fusarium vanettenii 77-13-4]|uniref:Heme haloperoxidase family profile domain-containing protein n=1 Tax=Fusarium vanettenii (strain ATCC MYA-4622 / CBS 123669 / FGSC 9596 / NRRL 45880 / 77-13-4) TaxID=660122 RepID=C7ZR92_FUSV7|nr:uncharacterized protein NECHADRAFT_89462 [Fusarium vanettenii 77-13-4]EEU33465.1 hypothetical protein NECHADRAFT_89462 [Fusarium vanettenii 77-13-4]
MGQKAIGHNDLFIPSPHNPVPYKEPFEWDEKVYYYEKTLGMITLKLCLALPAKSILACALTSISLTRNDRGDGETLTLEDTAEHYHRRHNDSKATNPNFRFGNNGAICSLAQYANMFGMLGRYGKNGPGTLHVEDVKKFYLDEDWPKDYWRR